MVNQPAFNPNDREQLAVGRYRNRAATDIFEPGSSIKPFVMAAALASGRMHDDSVIDTAPGFVKVGIKVIEDKHNLGSISLATILAKSSNVGMAKIALQLQPQQIWNTLDAFGFGQVSTSGFPGESAGLLTNYNHWRPIGIATLGVWLRLVRNPAAARACLRHARERRRGATADFPGASISRRVANACSMSTWRARSCTCWRSVITPEGTGIQAALAGYRVAGKTGTAWKATAGGYSNRQVQCRYLPRVVPASAPRLAAVVVIDEPGGTKYYGGDVAAPVFAGVLSGALRLMAIAPDDLPPETSATLARAEVEP